jgi:hypothetical protein
MKIKSTFMDSMKNGINMKMALNPEDGVQIIKRYGNAEHRMYVWRFEQNISHIKGNKSILKNTIEKALTLALSELMDTENEYLHTIADECLKDEDKLLDLLKEFISMYTHFDNAQMVEFYYANIERLKKIKKVEYLQTLLEPSGGNAIEQMEIIYSDQPDFEMRKNNILPVFWNFFERINNTSISKRKIKAELEQLINSVSGIVAQRNLQYFILTTNNESAKKIFGEKMQELFITPQHDGINKEPKKVTGNKHKPTSKQPSKKRDSTIKRHAEITATFNRFKKLPYNKQVKKTCEAYDISEKTLERILGKK